MSVDVDESRCEDQPGAVDHFRRRRGDRPDCTDRDDSPAPNRDISCPGGRARTVDDRRPPDDEVDGVVHLDIASHLGTVFPDVTSV